MDALERSRIAARELGVTAEVEAVGRRELARKAADLFVATGCQPVIVDARGKPHVAIAQAAEELGASLVITGSRGLAGIAALRSVSERVGESAGCSVLVARSAGGPMPRARSS